MHAWEIPNIGSLGFRGLEVAALAAPDLSRARRFYGETLALPPAFEGAREVGYLLGTVILMRKSVPDGWYARPSEQLNPRITVADEHAPDTEPPPRYSPPGRSPWRRSRPHPSKTLSREPRRKPGAAACAVISKPI